MIELLTSGLMAFWFSQLGFATKPDPLLVWHQATPPFVVVSEPEPVAVKTVEDYLQAWKAKSMDETLQGVWIQSGAMLLASNQGTTPLPAASLTKVATSLAALQIWQPTHRFETWVRTTGTIQKGVLQGDLIIIGGKDPYFRWEDAIALGNTLNQLGITKIIGNLVIVGQFFMNYEPQPRVSGEQLLQALNPNFWTGQIESRYVKLPGKPARPRVEITGTIKTSAAPPANTTLLLRHQSIPLAQILKVMNVYSHNALAETLADAIGGAKHIKQLATDATGVPSSEILLQNGSGLGLENRISPRGVAAMFIALQETLTPYHLNLADLFPVIGQDQAGTALDRKMPKLTIMKTGTLYDVSALAGVLPTRDRGLVWFSIINRGDDIEGLRIQQDELLNHLIKTWGISEQPPAVTIPSPQLKPGWGKWTRS